jgi:hypothetical protein
MLLVRRHPFRCRACKCRFYKYRSEQRKSSEEPVDEGIGPDNSKAV